MISIDKLKVARYIYQLRQKEFLRDSDELSDDVFLLGVDNLIRHLAGNYHGLLFDIELEKKIHQRFFPSWTGYKPRRIKKVMHVASLLYKTGGHTKVVKNWLADDPCSVGLVVTRQSDLVIDPINGVKVAALGDLEPMKKAEEIARLYKEWDCDLIIMHHHPYDVIPFIVRKFIPDAAIAVYNHADHVPWIGSGYSDLVINFRKCAFRVSIDRRCAHRAEMLPFEFDSAFVEQIKDKEKIYLLSMAASYKYIPVGEVNLLSLFADFLSNHPEVEMTVIGVDHEFFNKHVSQNCPDNLVLPGLVLDSEEYLRKAHYFIEPFPISSLLACLDACEYGAIPIFAYGQIHNIYGTGFSSIFLELDYRTENWTKQDYIEFLEREILSSSYRKRAIVTLRKMTEKYNKEAWKSRLREIYESFEIMNEPLRSMDWYSGLTESEDLNWHRFSSRDQGKSLRNALLNAKKLSLVDMLKGLWYAWVLRRNDGLYFPNNDFKRVINKR